jgi:hypothetical protein
MNKVLQEAADAIGEIASPGSGALRARIRELEEAILVHRREEPKCRCGFEIVLPSKPTPPSGGVE